VLAPGGSAYIRAGSAMEKLKIECESVGQCVKSLMYKDAAINRELIEQIIQSISQWALNF
jgi:hypothetical protein